MHGNSLQPANLDLVQRMLPFESGEYPFNSSSLGVDSLPRWQSHYRAVRPLQDLMPRRKVNDWFSRVLVSDKVKQGFSRVTLVCNHVVGFEFPAQSAPSVTEYVRRSFEVMNVPCADVSRNRQFRFAVHHKVQFPAECKFLLIAVCASLDAPVSLSIGFLTLVSIRPCLNRGGIDGNALCERWEASSVFAYKLAGNILNQVGVSPVSKAIEEPRKGGFVRDFLNGIDPADLRDIRIPFKFSNQSSCRGNAEGIPSDKATPKDFDWIAFWSASHFSSESIQKWLIFEIGENSFEFRDDRRYFDTVRYGIIGVRHGEATTFSVTRGRGHCNCLRPRLFLLTFYERFSYKYYPISRRQNLHFLEQFPSSFYEGVSYENSIHGDD